MRGINQKSCATSVLALMIVGLTTACPPSGECKKQSEEICDDKCDNNGDGYVNERCPGGGYRIVCNNDEKRSCVTPGAPGECATHPGSQTCVDGRWAECEGALKPGVNSESCTDEVDNDCDGRVNEGCLCDPGTTTQCGIGIGACTKGTQTCQNDYTWGPCTGAVQPTAEVCDGVIDQNCNGISDFNDGCQCLNGAIESCGANDVGICRHGVRTCSAGIWGACIGAITPQTELCDGHNDENCDGRVDEFCECTNGATQNCGLTMGACRSGTQNCANGHWGQCTGAVVASQELCDGIDSNCNGKSDREDGCVCLAGETKSCGVNVGACRFGTQTCSNQGAWSDCVGGTGPATEVCGDGIDNDCNGQVDELATCECHAGDVKQCGTNVGACSFGSQLCGVNGRWGFCLGGQNPVAEVCDGVVDGNCNGVADHLDGCECVNGTSQSCGSSVGACTPGSQLCTNGHWNPCFGGTVPSQELCDGVDQSCNGKTDIEDGCACIEGQTKSCGSNVGECIFGVSTCSNLGIWSSCVGGVTPKTEVCGDGKDNDCNGLADELPSCQCRAGNVIPCGSAVGACTKGTQTCGADGTYGVCVGGQLPVAEVCDGLVDGNCNGKSDTEDGCECVNGTTQNCGSSVGACRFGVQTCTLGHWGQCVGGTVPTQELCDGIDSNCNGKTDIVDGCACVLGQTKNCGSNVGACTFGAQTCDVDGVWSDCVGGTTPKTEVCGDGIDNDCSGRADELASCQCRAGDVIQCGSNVGQCRFGTQTCGASGIYGPCLGGTGPAAEVCDGLLDSNCNGVPDLQDGCECLNGTVQNCGSNVGQCRFGTQTCANGRFGQCVGGTGPAQELCDGMDSNCNGKSDIEDGCWCIAGQTTQCGYMLGACSPGIATCNVQGFFDSCVGGVNPVPEMCGDGIDNDCNGSADELSTCQCRTGDVIQCGSNIGACRFGTQTCGASGTYGPCLGGTSATTEVCDGVVDSNCNNVPDLQDGCDCVNGAVQNCGSNIGQCLFGTQTCANGKWGQCIGGTVPAQELCDGLDSNCNGKTDTVDGCACILGQTKNCGSDVGACAFGTSTCDNLGNWGICTGGTKPATEVCGDGVDNDCNGSVDELSTCQCRVGDVIQCGSNVGACTFGTQTCGANGRWGFCLGGTNAAAEVCDGLVDGNCNGVPDLQDGCECINGATQNCGSNVGACSFGTQTCVNGHFGACVGGVVPAQELCDNIDSNCNGKTDTADGCLCIANQTLNCGSNVGACRFGTQTCNTAGVFGSCVGGITPVAESCGDGLDNNCNGSVDELPACVCLAGTVTQCGSNVGACTFGSQTCQANGTYGPCVGGQGPVAEVCDGVVDGNCNGINDLLDGCSCVNGAIQSCGSNVGMCTFGTQTCVNGTFAACVGGTVPAQELCDGLDSNCNGKTDLQDGCACVLGQTRNCGSSVGACRLGTQTCDVNGVWGTCAGGVVPAAEACDGADNNCNGSTDEGCACTVGVVVPCGVAVGTCTTGTQTCVSPGTFAACTGQGPVTEVCGDGKDNDCNGQTDENCSSSSSGASSSSGSMSSSASMGSSTGGSSSGGVSSSASTSGSSGVVSSSSSSGGVSSSQGGGASSGLIAGSTVTIACYDAGGGPQDALQCGVPNQLCSNTVEVFVSNAKFPSTNWLNGGIPSLTCNGMRPRYAVDVDAASHAQVCAANYCQPESPCTTGTQQVFFAAPGQLFELVVRSGSTDFSPDFNSGQWVLETNVVPTPGFGSVPNRCSFQTDVNGRKFLRVN